MNVLCIGASSSVGRVLTRTLAQSHDVWGTYHKNEGPSPHIPSIRLDLTRVESTDSLPVRFPDGLRFDAVVCLSAVLFGKSLTAYTIKEMADVMAVNVLGHARAIQILYLGHRLAEPCHIILMSSIAGQRGSYDPIYAASKAGLIGLGKSLAQQIPHTRVNMLAPGLIEGSTMYEHMLPGIRESHRAATQSGKLLSLTALADLIADLLKPEWEHLNGAVIPINGGAYV